MSRKKLLMLFASLLADAFDRPPNDDDCSASVAALAPMPELPKSKLNPELCVRRLSAESCDVEAAAAGGAAAVGAATVAPE